MNALKDGKRRRYSSEDNYITTVDKKLLLHPLNYKTAYEMWIKIKAIFKRDNEQQKQSLTKFLWTNSWERIKNYKQVKKSCIDRRR